MAYSVLLVRICCLQVLTENIIACGLCRGCSWEGRGKIRRLELHGDGGGDGGGRGLLDHLLAPRQAGNCRKMLPKLGLPVATATSSDVTNYGANGSTAPGRAGGSTTHSGRDAHVGARKWPTFPRQLCSGYSNITDQISISDKGFFLSSP